MSGGSWVRSFCWRSFPLSASKRMEYSSPIISIRLLSPFLKRIWSSTRASLMGGGWFICNGHYNFYQGSVALFAFNSQDRPDEGSPLFKIVQACSVAALQRVFYVKTFAIVRYG